MSSVLYSKTKADPLKIVYSKIPASVNNVLHTEGLRIERHKSQVVRMILIKAAEEIKEDLDAKGIKVQPAPTLKSEVAKSKAKPKAKSAKRKQVA